MARTKNERATARPSRAERQANKLATSMLGRVDKRGRTRSAKTTKQEISRFADKHPDEFEAMLNDSRPPRKLANLDDGGAIYSGKWRGFSESFSTAWWADQPTPWHCAICNAVLNARGVGAHRPSIDHIQDWATMKLGIETMTVCVNNRVHWEVCLTEDVRAVLEDSSNLRPACQGCNSSKNGAKDTDPIAPQRKAHGCPGAGCHLAKAIV